MSRRRRIGWVREVAIFVPGALLLVALLSLLTLAAYRGAVEGLREERGLAADEPATGELGRQERLADRLTWVVVPGLGAVTLLLLVYLRRLLTPWEELAARARQVDPEASDDIGELVAAFDDALSALAERRAEGELAALQEALGRDLDTGVLVADGELAALEVNAVGRQLLGAGADGDDDPLASWPAVREALVAARDGGRAVQRACSREGDPSAVTLGVSAYPLRRDDGSVRGVLALFADLTAAAREERRARLAASLSQLGELSAGLAHELRNGLATVRGYLTLIERRPDAGSVDEYLDAMRGEADHLQRVLDDFLAFARPEPPEETTVDLADLARQAAADPALGEARVVVRAPDGEPPTVAGDRGQLRRALRNLLLNAAQAQRAAGVDEPIELVVEHRAGRTALRVLDRGPGLGVEDAGRLLQPFVAGRADGVGLGLALTQRIAVLHGGGLELRSREPGPGAEAVFWLADGQSDTFRNDPTGPAPGPAGDPET